MPTATLQATSNGDLWEPSARPGLRLSRWRTRSVTRRLRTSPEVDALVAVFTGGRLGWPPGRGPARPWPPGVVGPEIRRG